MSIECFGQRELGYSDKKELQYLVYEGGSGLFKKSLVKGLFFMELGCKFKKATINKKGYVLRDPNLRD